jgi:hypothetical protein
MHRKYEKMSDHSPAPLLDSTRDHVNLKDWLAGKMPDKALVAMSISAGSKKPGRAVERIAKNLGGNFTNPRIIKWEKGNKFVYAGAYTATTLGSALAIAADHPQADLRAAFQTDLYLKTQGDYTEIDVATVAAITQEALAALGTEMEVDEVRLHDTLKSARVFSTGILAAKIAPDAPHDFLIPYGTGALRAVNLPIARTEHDKKVAGQVVAITGYVPGSGLTAGHTARMEGLAVALTKDGFPGADALGEMVARNARTF